MQLYKMTVTTTFGHNVAVWAEDEFKAEEFVLREHENWKFRFTPQRLCCPPDIEFLEDNEDKKDPCVVLNPEANPEDKND